MLPHVASSANYLILVGERFHLHIKTEHVDASCRSYNWNNAYTYAVTNFVSAAFSYVIYDPIYVSGKRARTIHPPPHK
jgi:hypothetical protein